MQGPARLPLLYNRWMAVERILDSSVEHAERLVTAVVQSAAPQMPARDELSSLLRRERVEVAVICLGIAGQSVVSWRRRYYKARNRENVAAFTAAITAAEPAIADQLLVANLRHLLTVETLAYVPRAWDMADPDQARVAILAAGLALRVVGSDWLPYHRRFVRRLRRKYGSNIEAIDAAGSG